LQRKWKNGGWGRRIADIAVIADIARDRKTKPHHWPTRMREKLPKSPKIAKDREIGRRIDH